MDEILVAFLFTFASILSTIITVLIIVAIYILCSGVRVIHLGEGLPGAFDDSEQFLEEETEALEMMDDRSRQSYLMAKRWIEHNPPNSADTDISLSQYMTIQEKAVAAWEFTFDILQQPFIHVQNRTELEFRGTDDIGCVQTNLPLPKQREVYYWEAKIYDMAPDTKISVGLTTKPYPMFRLPGMHRYSVAYDSTAHRRLNQPFTCPSYGRPWQRGDVIGVGYRTRSGTVFFTHNGKKLDDVVQGLRLNVFPTIGATGPANIYVNLGQDGFVFIPAQVKSWGLAPAQGSLAPPPAYGEQYDSLLLEGTGVGSSSGLPGNPGPSNTQPPYTELHQDSDAPPYVRRRSSDDAHLSISSNSATDGIHTPPGSPPPPPLPQPPRNHSSEAPSVSDLTSSGASDDTPATTTEATPELASERTSENLGSSDSTPTSSSSGIDDMSSTSPSADSEESSGAECSSDDSDSNVDSNAGPNAGPSDSGSDQGRDVQNDVKAD